ncbi:helix-turn-helix transcriptional regulator [Tomitella gaofuii]|uniref:helix-turn-helix transcriptional regulator n=1 Tax=Tomitella gaofuii TaxID=2760083 RepID=UPI0015FE1798
MAVIRVRAGVLDRARKQAGVKSEQAFAQLLGVSRETIRLVEAGERIPSNPFIAALCVTTRKPLHELVTVGR